MIKKALRRLLASNNALARFTVRSMRDYRISKIVKSDFITLEISGGSRPISREYLNIDISDAPEVDIVTNLLDKIPLQDNFCNQIISIATLEHFNVNDVRHVLGEFYRLLIIGGTVEIGVPSIEKIFHQYQIKGCDDEVLRYTHGALKDQYDVHYFVVDSKRFISELQAIGFKDAKEVPYDFPRHSKDFMMKIVAVK